MTSNVMSLFESAAEKYPQKKAIAAKDKSYTFSQMKTTASKLATRFNRMTNEPIAVLVDRSAEIGILFAAVLYSGNYYIPIDPDMPAEKIQAILDDAMPKYILGTEETRPLCFWALWRQKILFCQIKQKKTNGAMR